MKNGYYVTDAHCHIYPEKIAVKAIEATDGFYGATSKFTGTAENLASVCLKYGVDCAVVHSVATTPSQVRSINRFIAQEVKNSNGFFTGLGTLNPDGDDIKGDIEYILQLGLKGVKLHPDIQHFKADESKAVKIYEYCEAAELPILMHTGDCRFDFSNPNRVLPILKAYPKLTVIGAHFGGWSVWEEAVEAFAEVDNFYVDCSSCFGFIDRTHVKELINQYDADRILFGSDYPMWNVNEELEALFSLELSENENRKILSENAAMLFGTPRQCK